MAAGVSLHGGSWGYGPGSSLFLWATQEAWAWFDGWCCVRGIDPWDIPVPRLINLIWFALQEYVEEKNNNEATDREDFINRDHIMAPVEQFRIYKGLLKPFQEKKPTRTSSQAQPAPNSESVPKKLGQKTDYVPPWWKGERAAYESAKRAMSGINSLPKMKK